MHVADVQDFHVAHRHCGPSDLTLGSLSSADLWCCFYSAESIQNSGPGVSALFPSCRCVAIIAGTNELNETVTLTSCRSLWRPIESQRCLLALIHCVLYVMYVLYVTVFPCHTCLFFCIITANSHNELFLSLCSFIYLFLFC